jgi:hypothetical protein
MGFLPQRLGSVQMAAGSRRGQGICVAMTALRPVLGVSASLHDFGDYGGVGVQRPLLQAGGLPLMLPQLPEA